MEISTFATIKCNSPQYHAPCSFKVTWCKTAFINNQAIQILSEEFLLENSLPFPTFLLLWRYVHTIVQNPIFNEMANGCTVTEFIEACARLIMSCMEPLVYIYICHSMPIRCCETLMLICFQKDANHNCDITKHNCDHFSGGWPVVQRKQK